MTDDVDDVIFLSYWCFLVDGDLLYSEDTDFDFCFEIEESAVGQFVPANC